LPPVGALDQLRGANGDNLIERARTNPRWAVAIAAGAVLILAWIGWAIYVTSSNGATAGLGVVLAWPALLAALALISLPFIGGYLLIRRLSDGEGSTATAEADDGEGEEEDDGDADDEPEDSAEDEGEEEDSEEDEDSKDEDDEDEDESDDDDSESKSKSKAKKS
jgi:flagellar biosynthesis/type III secretory pathway M-ring protein FliF/YscJ